MSDKTEVKYTVTCSIDDLCYMDFYSGHGHAFEPDTLIGCLPFSPYVDPSLTNQEIEDLVIENINSYDPDILNPDHEDLIRDLPDKDFREAYKDEIIDHNPADKPFKNLDLGPDVQLIGYFHIHLDN